MGARPVLVVLSALVAAYNCAEGKHACCSIEHVQCSSTWRESCACVVAMMLPFIAYWWTCTLNTRIGYPVHQGRDALCLA